jgi:hypothetical protein
MSGAGDKFTETSQADALDDSVSGDREGSTERKPDPDEPWRYACPECGSVDLTQNITPNCDESRFSCGACFWYGRRSELVDRQEQ